MTVFRDQEVAAGVEQAVTERYAAGAEAAEAALCCPIDYDPRYLAVLPPEILERDYGCGDPSRFVAEGDVVLDLGSGGGKICYIASQLVGPHGRVIGVDMTDAMLDLARRHQATVAERVGWDNVTFFKGRIQDLRTDMDVVAARLATHPIHGLPDLHAFESWKRARFAAHPMVADGSVDVVVSNCVLNLVESTDRAAMFDEIVRVLKKGGKAAISDIVCDEVVPEHLRHDPYLWTGCLSGAWQESEFLAAFERAGLHGVHIAAYQSEPWQVIEGIEFRSMTVVAYKGKQGACWDCKQAVVYRGPYKEVRDDDGHVYPRGVRVAVCEKTFRLLSAVPYADQFLLMEPRERIAVKDAEPFPCALPALPGASSSVLVRSPRETKGAGYDATITCAPGSGCC